jgi:hypothetical protein
MAKRLTILALVLLGFTTLGWSASAKRAGYGGIAASVPLSDYAGSSKCMTCHEEAYTTWSKKAMTRFVREVTDPAELNIDLAGCPFDLSRVKLAVGLTRRMEFVDHNWELIPYSYDITSRQWRHNPPRGQGRAQAWGQRQGRGRGRGMGGRGRGMGRGRNQGRGGNQAFGQAQDYRKKCGVCHLTGLDPASGGFVELNVGCESCHGPGSKHVGSQEPGDIRLPGGEGQPAVLSLCQKCHLGHHGFAGPMTTLNGDFHQ